MFATCRNTADKVEVTCFLEQEAGRQHGARGGRAVVPQHGVRRMDGATVPVGYAKLQRVM